MVKSHNAKYAKNTLKTNKCFITSTPYTQKNQVIPYLYSNITEKKKLTTITKSQFSIFKFNLKEAKKLNDDDMTRCTICYEDFKDG